MILIVYTSELDNETKGKVIPMSKDVNRIVTLELGIIPNVPDMFDVDPGTTSGWAHYCSSTGKVECGQLGPSCHQLELLTLIEYKLALSPDDSLELLFERFEFRHFEEALRRALRGYINQLRAGDPNTMVKGRALNVITNKLSEIAESIHTKYNLVLDSREYIGTCKLAAQRNPGRIQLASQGASEALSFATDNMLEALGWLVPTRGLPHARDALRHLVKRLVSRYGVRHPITTACFKAMKSDTRV